MSIITRVYITSTEAAASMSALLKSHGTSSPREELRALANYIQAIECGAKNASVAISVGERSGVTATGTITISSGSGVITATIAGYAVGVTWATSDTNSATLLKNAINADKNISHFVVATSSSGVVTLTAVPTDAAGDQITLAVTGTNVTKSAATLTGSIAVAATGTLTMASSSGTVGGTIGGTAVTVTWGTSDTLSAAALATAINANATVSKWVSATSALGVVTLTAVEKSALGNNVTLVASGSNVSASGAKLTGGVSAVYGTLSRG